MEKKDIIDLEETELDKEELESESEEEKEYQKDKKRIKNVSIKQCIGTIIFSVLALVVLFIPYTFGNSGMKFAFALCPIFGDGTITETPIIISQGAATLFGMESLIDIFQILLDLDTLIFIFIIFFNVFFSLVLAISKSEILRFVCKIITIIAGFLMIVIMLSSILHLVGIIGALTSGVVEMQNFMAELEVSGVLFALGSAIISGLMIKRQFCSFAKLY